MLTYGYIKLTDRGMTMPRDKTANHIKLMGAARQEFLECGFEKASMRSIGERCGLTAAGIYRHCRNKEDLFDQLVMPFVQRIDEWLNAHIARYVDAVNSGQKVTWSDSEVDMMRELLNYLPMLRAEGYAVRDIDPKELHLLLTAYTTALFEPVMHNYSQKEALSCLETVEAFFLPGWKNLFGI